jgi:glyoxylase-like metal-dependent hydrolase (beta-lactamase superfamily II)
MRLIDVRHRGRPRVIGCWVVDDLLIDPGPTSCLDTLLAGLDGLTPRALLLTHIHLDHAGVSGSLVERWPELQVFVHERGAPHLIDPARLLESARRLYGENMDPWWGEVVPVPEANLRVLGGGERIIDGTFEVAYTPGHASHHVAYLHEGTAFVGDVGGVRIDPDSLTIPPTPPPDIDIERGGPAASPSPTSMPMKTSTASWTMSRLGWTSGVTWPGRSPRKRLSKPSRPR